MAADDTVNARLVDSYLYQNSALKTLKPLSLLVHVNFCPPTRKITLRGTKVCWKLGREGMQSIFLKKS